MKTPTTLIIMDGFGVEGPSAGNAVVNASTPNLDRIFSQCPGSKLSGSQILQKCLQQPQQIPQIVHPSGLPKQLHRLLAMCHGRCFLRKPPGSPGKPFPT